MSKQVVHYIKEQSYTPRCVGDEGYLVVVDHPNFERGSKITTSAAIGFSEGYVFETENTVYVPVHQLNG